MTVSDALFGHKRAEGGQVSDLMLLGLDLESRYGMGFQYGLKTGLTLHLNVRVRARIRVRVRVRE